MQIVIPEYTRRMVLAFERYPDLFPGGMVTHRFVEHDHWCRLLVQSRPCDCNPDVHAEIQGRRYKVFKVGGSKRADRTG
jgi:hypothetical protein